MKKILMALAAAATVTAAPVAWAIPVSGTVVVSSANLPAGSPTMAGVSIVITNNNPPSTSNLMAGTIQLPTGLVFDQAQYLLNPVGASPVAAGVSLFFTSTQVTFSTAGDHGWAPGESLTFHVDVDTSGGNDFFSFLTPGSFSLTFDDAPGTTAYGSLSVTGGGSGLSGTAAVPEPGSLALLGAAMAGLGIVGFRRKRT